VNLELNGNQISEAGVEAVKGVLQQAGKVLGGTCSPLPSRYFIFCFCNVLLFLIYLNFNIDESLCVRLSEFTFNYYYIPNPCRFGGQ